MRGRRDGPSPFMALLYRISHRTQMCLSEEGMPSFLLSSVNKLEACISSSGILMPITGSSRTKQRLILTCERNSSFHSCAQFCHVSLQAVVIRELIIRCLSQMVLARVANIKSGWKSMFMVFTTAAGDNDPTIVRLAFDTIEKIVREHFNYITGEQEDLSNFFLRQREGYLQTGP